VEEVAEHYESGAGHHKCKATLSVAHAFGAEYLESDVVEFIIGEKPTAELVWEAVWV